MKPKRMMGKFDANTKDVSVQNFELVKGFMSQAALVNTVSRQDDRLKGLTQLNAPDAMSMANPING